VQEEEVQKNLIDKNQILEALHFRHACKIFDETKKISDENINFILESGRLSPSSFGMEHWKFIVIENLELKKKLKPFCWNQDQIDSCSHLIALVAKTKSVEAGGEYRKKMLSRKGLSEELLMAYLQKYDSHLSSMSTDEVKFWAEKQCYIAGANMATVASMIGIDSCFIEGFQKNEVSKILGLDDNVSLAYLLAFGYRKNLQSKKIRLNFDEVVQFIK
jgi:nitroreductase